MADFVIRTGDLLEVTIPVPAVIPALAAPLPLTGSSSNVTVGGTPVCLQGDELPVVLRAPLVYTAPPCTVPGTGTLVLTLSPGNLTRKTTNGGKPILIGGGTFTAMFTVQTPATQPPPASVPDPLLQKPGTARFITTNTSVTAG
ncbi:hypothetical protein OG352_08145 [Streptomyces sp. NBC_01485]|uniref:hypothetical protein n=1 Tax=Streptomyces sp. NBC_01485 TaxID=2903884 RepID=UPI002E31F1A8|nr:hypothetical protein [Streptomyces sp. NBC_01485]